MRIRLNNVCYLKMYFIDLNRGNLQDQQTLKWILYGRLIKCNVNLYTYYLYTRYRRHAYLSTLNLKRTFITISLFVTPAHNFNISIS